MATTVKAMSACLAVVVRHDGRGRERRRGAADGGGDAGERADRPVSAEAARRTRSPRRTVATIADDDDSAVPKPSAMMSPSAMRRPSRATAQRSSFLTQNVMPGWNRGALATRMQRDADDQRDHHGRDADTRRGDRPAVGQHRRDGDRGRQRDAGAERSQRAGRSLRVAAGQARRRQDRRSVSGLSGEEPGWRRRRAPEQSSGALPGSRLDSRSSGLTDVTRSDRAWSSRIRDGPAPPPR